MSDILTGEAFTAKLNVVKKRNQDYTQRANRANAKLEERKSSYIGVQNEAEELFGTREPEDLRKELTRREKRNHETLVAYEAEVSKGLVQVDALEKALNGDAE